MTENQRRPNAENMSKALKTHTYAQVAYFQEILGSKGENK